MHLVKCLNFGNKPSSAKAERGLEEVEKDF